MADYSCSKRPRCSAPSENQRWQSCKMHPCTWWGEAEELWNNLLFLSLQRCHTISMNTLFGSFRFGAGCSRLKCVHRCCKERVFALKEQLQPREFITPHQICLVKEQWTRMWTLVSFSWSQRRQCSCASSPCQRRLSAVQILHLMGHGSWPAGQRIWLREVPKISKFCSLLGSD